MKNRISLQELIAFNNTPKAKSLIVKYGYEPSRNYDDLVYKLIRFTKEYKDEALQELSNIHPHKDLILNYNELENKTEKEEKSSFDNEECKCRLCRQKRIEEDKKYINFEGEINNIIKSTELNTQKKQEINIKEILPIVAVASITTILMFTILKNVK